VPGRGYYSVDFGSWHIVSLNSNVPMTRGSAQDNWLRADLNERGAAAVIPSKADRAGRIPHDTEMYKWRHLVENFFQRLKEFRRIATRYDKTDTSFAAAIYLVATFLALK